MTLQDFVKSVKSDLDRFEEYWIRQHYDDPGLFPHYLQEGEWIEHFECFREMPLEL